MNRLSLLCVPLTSTNSSLFIGIYLFTLLWFTLTLRVRTHQQSRVESNPVQSDSQRRGSDSVAYVEWPPRPCVHTSRVESSLASLAESRVLIPHASFSSFRLQWSGVTEEMDVEKLILLVRPPGNLRRLALWTPEPRLTLIMMFITTKITALLTTEIMILLLLGFLFKVKV